MSTDLNRSIRVLQGYAIVLTLALAALAVIEWRQLRGAKRFTEVDAERINIVEPDGTIRLVLSDKARFPGLILKRKEYPHPRGSAGLLFFNDEGTEDGGLAFTGSHSDSGTTADGELMFDQYGQDETVGIEYSDAHGQRAAGFHVWDRPDSLSIAELLARLQAIRAMPEGPARTQAFKALHDKEGSARVFAGKSIDRSAVVALSDLHGRPRLRLSVDTTGVARIEFLDSAGHVARAVGATGR